MKDLKEIIEENNKADVNKEQIVTNEIKLSNGWSIEKTTFGYTLSNSSLHVFIHGDRIGFVTKNEINAWLNVFQNDVYISTIWIDNSIEIKKIKEFIKVE